MDTAAQWFNSKWGVPKEAYLECMQAYLSGESELGWYLCLDGEKIVGGMGVIENDFHDRKDLSPNVCAVYTEDSHRKLAIAVQPCEGVLIAHHGNTVFIPLHVDLINLDFHSRSIFSFR